MDFLFAARVMVAGENFLLFAAPTALYGAQNEALLEVSGVIL